MSERVYFDWNASAPLRDEAREAFLRALGAANASSVHAEGRAARAVDRAGARAGRASSSAPKPRT